MDHNITFYQKYPLICLATLHSELCLFPLDNIKTKMQFTNNSFIKLANNTIRTSGYKSLYKGFIPSVTRHWSYSGLRIGLYEELRKIIGNNDSTIINKILASGISGGVSQFISSPFDMVKINAITSPKNNITIMKDIYKFNGIKGFYTGVTPNVIRAISVNIGEIATYDISKRIILKYRDKEDFYTFSLASFFSGFSSAALCTPADTLRTKMMANNSKKIYKNTLDCLIKTTKQGGIKILYTGFYANWFRLAPWQLIFWNSYEFYRVKFGYGNF
jgi:solute carrier family 25 (mitochondrial uncoupling protein), member 27